MLRLEKRLDPFDSALPPEATLFEAAKGGDRCRRNIVVYRDRARVEGFADGKRGIETLRINVGRKTIRRVVRPSYRFLGGIESHYRSEGAECLVAHTIGVVIDIEGDAGFDKKTLREVAFHQALPAKCYPASPRGDVRHVRLVFRDRLFVDQNLTTGVAAMAATATGCLVVVFLAVIANLVAKRLVLRAVISLADRTETNWDDLLIERRVFHRFAHIAPALVINFFAPAVLGTDTSPTSFVTAGCLLAKWSRESPRRAAYSGWTARSKC